MSKISLNDIQNSLDNIESDIDNQLDDLESMAPDHMDFSKVRDAHGELKEQVRFLSEWLNKFDIGEVQHHIY